MSMAGMVAYCTGRMNSPRCGGDMRGAISDATGRKSESGDPVTFVRFNVAHGVQNLYHIN